MVWGAQPSADSYYMYQAMPRSQHPVMAHSKIGHGEIGLGPGPPHGRPGGYGVPNRPPPYTNGSWGVDDDYEQASRSTSASSTHEAYMPPSSVSSVMDRTSKTSKSKGGPHVKDAKEGKASKNDPMMTHMSIIFPRRKAAKSEYLLLVSVLFRSSCLVNITRE